MTEKYKISINNTAKPISADEFYTHLYDGIYNHLRESGVNDEVAAWLASIAVRGEKLERYES